MHSTGARFLSRCWTRTIVIERLSVVRNSGFPRSASGMKPGIIYPVTIGLRGAVRGLLITQRAYQYRYYATRFEEMASSFALRYTFLEFRGDGVRFNKVVDFLHGSVMGM